MKSILIILTAAIAITSFTSCEGLPGFLGSKQAQVVGRVLTKTALTALAGQLSESNPVASSVLLAGLNGNENMFGTGEREAAFDREALQFEADMEATLEAADPAQRAEIEQALRLAFRQSRK